MVLSGDKLFVYTKEGMMGIISKIFGDKKRSFENKKRSRHFVRIFGRVSSELGLFDTGLNYDLVYSLFDSMGQADNSADVFIQIVLVIHSHSKEKGLLILKQMGKGSIKGFGVDEIFDTMKYDELGSVNELMKKVSRDITRMLDTTDKKVLSEPVLLLMAFIMRLDQEKEKALLRQESHVDRRETMSLFDRLRNASMEPRLDVYRSDYNQIGKSKVNVPRETIYKSF